MVVVEPAEDEVNARRDVETLRADVLYVLAQSDADRRFEAATAVVAHLPSDSGAELLDAEATKTRAACDDALRVMIDAKGGTRAMAARWTETLRPRNTVVGLAPTGADGIAAGPAPLPGTVDLSTMKRPMIAAGLALAVAAAALVFLPFEVVTGRGGSASSAPERASAVTVVDTGTDGGSVNAGDTQQRGVKDTTTTTVATSPSTTSAPPVDPTDTPDSSADLALDERPVADITEANAVAPPAAPAPVAPPVTAPPPTVAPATSPTTAASTPAVPPSTTVAPSPAPTTVAPPVNAAETALSPREAARAERQRQREARAAAREAARVERARQEQERQAARDAARAQEAREQAARDAAKAEQGRSDNRRDDNGRDDNGRDDGRSNRGSDRNHRDHDRD